MRVIEITFINFFIKMPYSRVAFHFHIDAVKRVKDLGDDFIYIKVSKLIGETFMSSI